MKEIEILDCTLRDGGYYNDWDFADNIVDLYLSNLHKLPLAYIEIGYRNPLFSDAYNGQYFHLSLDKIVDIKQKIGGKKIAIMLDSKSIKNDDIPGILDPIVGIVDLIRLAVNPLNPSKSLDLAVKIKNRGFEIALNFMYLSKHPLTSEILENVNKYDFQPDFIYLVDSFGGATPELVKEQVTLLKLHYDGKIGFHGHNNLEMALINSITAINNGASIVDSTVLGMGRGAGNLKTELLLAYLVGNKFSDCNLEIVAKLVNVFKPLHTKYKWGTNLPYMIAGSLNFPQATVMNWLVSDRYSEDDIVSKVFSSSESSDKKYETCEIDDRTNDKNSIIIIGGGNTSSFNASKMIKYVNNNPGIKIYCTSLKHLKDLKKILHLTTFCLSGKQLRQVDNQDKALVSKIKRILLAPSPRNIEVSIPMVNESQIFELPQLHYSDAEDDSPLIIALELATLEKGKVEILGFDGYSRDSEKGLFLNNLNANIFQFYSNAGLHISSLTKTLYAVKQSPSIHAKTMNL